jgi:hypothetical protein
MQITSRAGRPIYCEIDKATAGEHCEIRCDKDSPERLLNDRVVLLCERCAGRYKAKEAVPPFTSYLARDPSDKLTRHHPLPRWARQFTEVIKGCRATNSVNDLSSGKDVLIALGPGLRSLGYEVERSKRDDEQLKRPRGPSGRTVRPDAFHGTLGIWVEIEAGKTGHGLAPQRDVIRASMAEDTRYLVIAMPHSIVRSSGPGQPKKVERCFRDVETFLEDIGASRYCPPLDGILLLGY